MQFDTNGMNVTQNGRLEAEFNYAIRYIFQYLDSRIGMPHL